MLSLSPPVSSVVSGETGKYVLGKTLSGGSDEVAQWLRERQAQSFDAVFVPAGVELAIHVDHELEIEKVDGKGGRLSVVFREDAELSPRMFSLLTKLNRECYFSRTHFIWPFSGSALTACDAMLTAIESVLAAIEAQRAQLEAASS